MKRVIYPIFISIILMLSLLKPINCLAAEPFFTDLIDAKLTNQDRIDYYNEMLGTERVKVYLDEINAYKNVFASLCYDEENYQYCELTFYCFNNDYVAFLYSPNGVGAINFISKNDEKVDGKVYKFRASFTDLNPDGTLNATLSTQPYDFSLDTVMTKNDITYYERDYWSCVTSYSVNNDGRNSVVRSDVPIFKSEDDAILYLEGNDISPLYCDTSLKVYYNENDLYFKSFTVMPHVTRNYDTFFFDVKYELSDFAKAHSENLNLRFDSSYAMSCDAVASLIRLDGENSSYSKSIDISDKPNGFRLYLNEIPCLYSLVDNKQLVSKNNILGKELLFDFSNLSIGNIGLNTVANITGSYLYCQFYLRDVIDGKLYQGKRNDFNYDFLTNKSEYDIWKSTDDSSLNGNLNYVKDGDTVTSNEYYYNDTTTNNDGTVVNNYYYYDNDGKEYKITEDEYLNGYVNANGGNATASGGNATANATVGDINININNGGGDYVNISPGDYKLFLDSIKSLLGEFDKEGGLFLLLTDVMHVFPAEIVTIIGAGLSAVVLVVIFCILKK